MSSRSTANYNGRLTNYAAGIAQKPRENGIADFVFPMVAVGASIGKYKKYSGKNAMQVYKTLRALGNEPNSIKFDATDGDINCLPHGLQIPIDDAERDAAGEETAAQQALEEGKTQTLIASAQLARELRAQELIDTITPVAGAGVWSNQDKDPIAELDNAIEAIVTATGLMPNRLALGFTAWKILRNHPKVIARFNGLSAGITADQLKSVLAVPLAVRIGTVSRDTNKWGNGKNAVQVTGAKALVFIGADAPTIYDPSFGKTFTTRRGGVDAVNVVRQEAASSDLVQVKWSEQMQTVWDEAAALISLS